AVDTGADGRKRDDLRTELVGDGQRRRVARVERRAPGAVDPAPAEQGTIGGVDDRVRLEPGQVTAVQADVHRRPLLVVWAGVAGERRRGGHPGLGFLDGVGLMRRGTKDFVERTECPGERAGEPLALGPGAPLGQYRNVRDGYRES